MQRDDSSLDADCALPRWAVGGAFVVVVVIVIIAIGGPAELFSSHWAFLADQPGHDWWLATFRSGLLRGSPFGWSTSTNNGFLFGYFYFPLPPVVVTLLATVTSVAVAEKLMVLLSVLSIPFGMWQLMKGLGYGRLAQALTILASIMALVSNHPSQIGGTLLDSLLGEFSIAFSIGFGLCTVGAYARFRRGVGPWWAVGVWGALSLLSHVQGGLATFIVLTVFCAWDLRSVVALRQLAMAGALALGLSAWWWIPAISVAGQSLGDINPVMHNLVPFELNADVGTLFGLGVIGLLLGTWRRRTGAREMLSAVVLISLALYLPLQIFDTGRMLPMVFLLAACGVAFLALELFELLRVHFAAAKSMMVVMSLALLVALGAPMLAAKNVTILTSWDAQPDRGMNAYRGYPAVVKLVSTLERLPPGRVMVETPHNYVAQFGDELWPALLPLWTHDHDASPIGLYVNATPSSIGLEYAHQNLTAAFSPVVSWQPNPASPVPTSGINQLRDLGVNYLVVDTPALHTFMKRDAEVSLVAKVNDPSSISKASFLTTVDTHGYFWVYKIKRAQTVVGVGAIVPMAPLATRAYAISMTQFLADEGVNPSIAIPTIGRSAYSGPTTSVTDIHVTNHRISFRVKRLNRPVLIRETYSPEWHVWGANQVYQAEPNEMMVVPTRHDVLLTFENPASVPLGFVVTLLSWVWLTALLLVPWRHRRGEARSRATV